MSKLRQLVILTGMSGAGKSLAASTFEDLDFYCIDNLPPAVIPQVVNLWRPPSEPQDVAIVADVRAGQFFDELLGVYQSLDKQPPVPFLKPLLVFLNADDATLVRRFKETRRKHPLVNKETGILDAIKIERTRLADLNEHADKVIDTSNLEPEGLRRLIRGFFSSAPVQKRLTIAVVSFGFKHGVPLDADLVFDVRFLANPYWVDELKNLDGNQDAVSQFVLRDPLSEPLLEKLFGLVEFSIPQYIKEGKAYLTIAIGCTGGRHRSVVVANELARFLTAADYTVRLEHRDLLHAGDSDAD